MHVAPRIRHSHLNIFAPSHLLKVLLLFKSFIHFVIRHAETAKSSLNNIVHLGKHHKLGQIWHTDQLPV